MSTQDRDVEGEPEANSSSAVSGSGRRPKKHRPIWQETIILFAVALGLAIVIKAFFVQAFYIPSESMEPGLQVNDRIMVEKWSYWGSGSPQRGDVVVFKDPGGWLGADATEPTTSPIKKALEKIGLYPAGGHLVKRVIGLPGDTIKCCDEKGRITVNNVPLTEPYLKNRAPCNGPMPTSGACNSDWTAGPVPKGRMFVMGDHRDDSADSSAHMCAKSDSTCTPGEEFVPLDDVVGRVQMVVWPRDHWRWLSRPSTFEDVPDGS